MDNKTAQWKKGLTKLANERNGSQNWLPRNEEKISEKIEEIPRPKHNNDIFKQLDKNSGKLERLSPGYNRQKIAEWVSDILSIVNPPLRLC
jgi:hypothetical protein